MKSKKAEKEVNLLEKVENEQTLEIKKKPRSKWAFLGKFFVYLSVVLILVGLTFSYKVILSANSVIASSDIPSLLGQLKYFVVAPEDLIDGEKEDRVNVLLLGMGGAGHSGGYLADTIMIASVKPSTKEVAFISIPRDLFVPIPDHNWRKINNAYAFGYVDDPESGGEKLMTEVIENITGLTIHYYGRADFEGFKKVIDDLGGVDVDVDRTFYDPLFPDDNYGYQPVSFQEGNNHFNGEKALQFARSRHGNNNEGSDFARSQRQQKILLALKDKLLSSSTLLNPSLILNVIGDLADHVRTNMEPWEMIKLYNTVKDVSVDQIIDEVIDNSPDGPLHSETTIDGAYILRPNAGPDDFSEIKDIAQNIFNTEETKTVKRENATIEIHNGTKISGLAAKTAETLRTAGYNVVAIGNATEQNNETTTIYDLTGGTKPQTLETLKLEIGSDVASTVPVYLYTPDKNEVTYQDLSAPLNSEIISQSGNVDFLILLGTDEPTRTNTSIINTQSQ
jgi:polyisoprenyl-teichoic acid--peptidoglycan teichoic acid transferase